MALKQLESFEAHASDPTRHFCRSTSKLKVKNYDNVILYIGSSLLRLREARQRATLHKVTEIILIIIYFFMFFKSK